MDRFRAHLQQVVALHTAMFDKLLFNAEDMPLSLAELFEDVGNTYLKFSEGISSRHLARHSDVEEQFDAGVKTARRIFQAEVRTEPGVCTPEHVAQPVKH